MGYRNFASFSSWLFSARGRKPGDEALEVVLIYGTLAYERVEALEIAVPFVMGKHNPIQHCRGLTLQRTEQRVHLRNFRSRNSDS